MTPPAGSATTPLSVPVVACAMAVAAVSGSMVTKASVHAVNSARAFAFLELCISSSQGQLVRVFVEFRLPRGLLALCQGLMLKPSVATCARAARLINYQKFICGTENIRYGGALQKLQ